MRFFIAALSAAVATGLALYLATLAHPYTAREGPALLIVMAMFFGIPMIMAYGVAMGVLELIMRRLPYSGAPAYALLGGLLAPLAMGAAYLVMAPQGGVGPSFEFTRSWIVGLAPGGLLGGLVLGLTRPRPETAF